MIYDLYHNLKPIIALKTLLRKATENGEAVDLKGFQGAMIVVQSGTLTDGTQTFSLQESANGTDFTNVNAAYIQGSVPDLAATDDDKVYWFGYIGHQRYIRVVDTVAGTTTGGVTGATAILGVPLHAPVV